MSIFLISIYHAGQPVAEACCRAYDAFHARIIGLHDGLHRGVVSKVKAEPLSMKTKTTDRAEQLLLWPQ